MRRGRGEILGWVFALLAGVFLVVGGLAGITAYLVHQQTPDNVAVIRPLITRAIFSVIFSGIAVFYSRRWFQVQ